jgi:2-haloacid dehalogenase
MAETIVAFDLYGTLLSTESIAKKLEKHFDHTKAQSISALWRRYQLEYTWRLNSMGEQSSSQPRPIANAH